MSKIGQWLLQMQEDAQHMTKKEFISEHCKSYVHIWEDAQELSDGEKAPEDYIKIEGGY